MVFKLSSGQIKQLQDLVDVRDYPKAYRELAGWIDGKPGVSPNVPLFLRGAADINAKEGPFSDFVRSYTDHQRFLREGIHVSNTQMQSVSDDIADTVLKGVIARHGRPDLDDIPSILNIGRDDAKEVSTQFFRGDFAGWVGAPFFLNFGYSGFFKDYILENKADTYDLLAVIEAGKTALGAIDVWSSTIPKVWESITITTKGAVSSSGTLKAAALEANGFLSKAYGAALPLVSAAAGNIFLGTLTKGDALSGSSKSDFVNGGAGDDTISWTAGSDILDGGEGKDVVSYANQSKALIATINTSTTAQAKYIGSVNIGLEVDALFNVEKIIGSSVDDDFILRAIPGDITIDGGAGTRDEISALYLTEKATIDASKGILTSGGASLHFMNIEKLQGTKFDDAITGSDGSDELRGDAGNDTIIGGGGRDFTYGGEGDDAFAVHLTSGRMESDYINGGAGADRVSNLPDCQQFSRHFHA